MCDFRYLRIKEINKGEKSDVETIWATGNRSYAKETKFNLFCELIVSYTTSFTFAIVYDNTKTIHGYHLVHSWVSTHSKILLF